MAEEGGKTMIEVGDFVTICTNGNDFLGDKSMFDGMVGEVLEIKGAIKPVYKVRIVIEEKMKVSKNA